MHPPSNCPQCSAPLPPGAPKCNFCGFLTPWGAAAAAHQQAQAAHQQQQAMLIADRDRRVRAQQVESSAKTAMIVALVGLPICCAPVSIVGGVLGWRASNMAKAEGKPRPTTALIAMIVAGVCTVTFTVALILFIRDERAKAGQLAEVQSRLKGKREAAALETKVACDLVEENLLQKGFGDHHYSLGAVHCDGALAVNDRRASLPDVRFAFGDKHFTANACLERRSRWYVIKVGEGLSCADLPPAAPFNAPARQLSDEEATADEEKARADLAKAAATSQLKAFTDKLAKVKAHAAAGGGAETVCDKTVMARYLINNKGPEVATIDVDYLGGARPVSNDAQWRFFTSARLRDALQETRTADDRVKDVEKIREEGGPLLVVFRSEGIKQWPVVHEKGDYKGGEFTGWLYVYDIDAGSRLCQAKLAFESSDEVSFKKRRLASEKASASDAIMADFKESFQKASDAALDRVAPDVQPDYN